MYKVTALGVLCCFVLFVCLTYVRSLPASFFLPSHLSFKNMYMYLHTHHLAGKYAACIYTETCTLHVGLLGDTFTCICTNIMNMHCDVIMFSVNKLLLCTHHLPVQYWD